ncbi:MAG: tRNA threonylcarbamoyladenosine dehydratase [Lachnospiraceae bacterium]|nr:tRNA threonylcarbamoyladenosine dehydratase [Lachnospiraceae bacterium]
MIDQFSRTKLLIGEKGVDKLANARVAVFGIGGVGGYVCEALARSGVGHFDLIDNDTVSLTNINRQIIALHSTVGKYKTEVMRDRMRDINPEVEVEIHNCFFLPENADEFDFSKYDYVVDAVDTVAAKLSVIVKAKEEGVPVISSMGAGNKLDPTQFKVADIYKTKVCPLAKVMRRELKNRGIKKLKVVYSEELPVKQDEKTVKAYNENDFENPEIEKKSNKRSTPGSTAFVPSVAGLIIAGEVIKDIVNKN